MDCQLVGSERDWQSKLTTLSKAFQLETPEYTQYKHTYSFMSWDTHTHERKVPE